MSPSACLEMDDDHISPSPRIVVPQSLSELHCELHCGSKKSCALVVTRNSYAQKQDSNTEERNKTSYLEWKLTLDSHRSQAQISST
jgi:hypothetical protein